MQPKDFTAVLERTLADRRLTRSEQKALRSLIADWAPSEHERSKLRSQSFEAARQSLGHHQDREVLDWLDEMLKILETPATPAPAGLAECYFSPGRDCLDRLLSLISGARATLDVCVFTITDDRIARSLTEAHRRGKKVRIITDDEKAFDPGSDITRLEDEGMEVRIDRLPAHMHHKFCLFDRAVLITGSYNWTRSAAEYNFENLLVSDDRRHVEPFQAAFEELWTSLTPRNQGS